MARLPDGGEPRDAREPAPHDAAAARGESGAPSSHASAPWPAAAADGDGDAAGASDRELVRRIGERDERALDVLSRRYGAAMHAVALRVTRADGTAEEVVQDALMALWRQPARYDPTRGALVPWLLSLTRYKAIDAVRRETTIRRHTADVDLELREAPDDVHDEVWLRMRRVRLQEAVGRLGADQRRALQLAFMGGLTHVEVAEREGIPLGTAKTRIRTALLNLRRELATPLAEVPAGGGDRVVGSAGRTARAAGVAPTAAAPRGPLPGSGAIRRPGSHERGMDRRQTGKHGAARAEDHPDA